MTKSRLKIVFIGLYLCLPVLMYGQVLDEATVSKSLAIDCEMLESGSLKAIDIKTYQNGFLLLEVNSSSLHVLNDSGRCTHHKVLVREDGELLEPTELIVGIDFLYVRNNVHIVRLDQNLEVVDGMILAHRWDNRYFERTSLNTPTFFIDEADGLLFYIFKEYDPTSSYIKQGNMQEHYAKPNIAVYQLPKADTLGLHRWIQPDYTFKARETDYLRKDGNLDHHNFVSIDFDTLNNKLVVSERMANEVSVYDYQGTALLSFGSKAKQIDESKFYYPTYSDSVNFGELAYYTAHSNAYLRVFKEDNYILRLYVVPVPADSLKPSQSSIESRNYSIQVYHDRVLESEFNLPENMRPFALQNGRLLFIGPTVPGMGVILEKPQIYFLDLKLED